LYQNHFPQWVACSHWLKDVAKQSSLIGNHNIVSIPNTLDQTIFKPDYKDHIRSLLNLPKDKKLILFGASNIGDKRKGLEYFVKSLQILKIDTSDKTKDIELIMFGKSKESLPDFGFKVHQLPFLSQQEDIAKPYQAADLFVIPSLEDNLPNTIMEALACGTPCVGFHTGGIPEMIDHEKNGYISTYKSEKSLAEGIYKTLYEYDAKVLSQNAVEKVNSCYSNPIVTQKYISLYNSLLNK